MLHEPELPSTPGRRTLSFEEFLARSAELASEWVEGEVVPLPPVEGDHNDLGLFLLRTLGTYVEMQELGLVRYEPFLMKGGPDLPARSPDLMFIAQGNLPRLKSQYLEGPADLAVEIISPDSRARDRGEKFYEYEQAGVQEYWLLDPRRKQPEFYQLGEEGFFHLVPIGPDGIYRSRAVEGFWIRVDWLWRRPFPKLMEILREWGLSGP